jgi:DNA-binding beta-propeller fold protein YncE
VTRGPIVSGAYGCMHVCESKLISFSKATMSDHKNRHAMSCSFLPPIPVPVDIIRGHARNAGIAANLDGTLFASVSRDAHCVYMYNVAAADPIIVGTAGTAGSAHGELDRPGSACFVHRDGVDTLLICDWGNDRVVEVTARGVFMRVIENAPRGIAYCGANDVIAVSLDCADAVVLLQYESGAVKPEVTIGSSTAGNADGQLFSPVGVTFTTDGRHILVADCWNHRVSKFSADSGAFVAHVISNGVSYPTDVLQCEDGSIVVAHEDGVTCVGKDGVTVEKFSVSSSVPRSLSNSPSLNGVVVKCFDGSVFVLRDAWSHSLRCEWVHACVRI